MKNYTLLTRAQYFQGLIDGARAAKQGERIMITAMGFDPTEPTVAKIVDALGAAAKRGARVLFLVDAHDLIVSQKGSPGPLFYHRTLENLHGEFATIVAALQRIRRHGGRCVIINMPKRPFTPSVMGRSHIKAAVIGNRMFVGCCNLERPKQIDAMVSWEYTYAADTLADWFERIAEAGNVREAFNDVDTSVQLDATTALLLDAGVPKQSLIYEESLRLIDDARDWLYITCQYFPGGPTAKHLAEAQARGVQVRIDFSHPRSQGPTSTLHQLHQLAMHTRRLPRSFFTGRLDIRAPKLHAKVLASEKAAIVGSHNYVIQGVQFGTAELALYSTDPAFALAVQGHIKSQLSQPQTISANI